MAWFDFLKLNNTNNELERINEAIKSFEKKGNDTSTLKQLQSSSGEGIDDIYAYLQGYGVTGLDSFNRFYSRFINRTFENEVARINEYRRMAESPEIADVIEDAVNESTQYNDDGNVIDLEITNEKYLKNNNIRKILQNEFHDLFYNRIKINEKLWEMFRRFYIDGRVYYERIVNENNVKRGIVNIKLLPSETMDFEYDLRTGKILTFYQYLTMNAKRPASKEDAKKTDNVVIFNPEQIGYLNYGIFGKTKYEIYGFLEKARIPYNQLKLLETSVIIYRIVRAPERFVFKIDTGNMPRDKALKFVEKIKSKYIKKQSYDPSTGNLTQEPEVLSILENFWLPVSADGRGSSIETVGGGNAAGFTELDDIYYFAKKLYRTLKYPLSRVTASNEGRDADVIVGGSKSGEISRDEIKWAKFLERQQNIFCNELRDLFLLHLEFKGIKKQYNLDIDDIKILITPPSHYNEQMEQSFLEQNFSNYNALSNNAEFSKYYLIKKYLKWSDEDIEENYKGFEMDKKYGLSSDMDDGLDNIDGVNTINNEIPTDEVDYSDITPL